jgi:hypothetical protein
MNGIPLAGTPRQVRCFYGLSVTANTYNPPGALLFATAYPFGHTTEPGLAAGHRFGGASRGSFALTDGLITLGTGTRVQEEECHRYRHDDRADQAKPI